MLAYPLSCQSRYIPARGRWLECRTCQLPRLEIASDLHRWQARLRRVSYLRYVCMYVATYFRPPPPNLDGRHFLQSSGGGKGASFDLYIPTIPAFDAAYTLAPRPACVARRLATLMMQPDSLVSRLVYISTTLSSYLEVVFIVLRYSPSFCLIIFGMKAWQPSVVPSRFTFKICCMSATSVRYK